MECGQQQPNEIFFKLVLSCQPGPKTLLPVIRKERRLNVSPSPFQVASEV